MNKNIILKTGEEILLREPKKTDVKMLLKYINDLSAEKTFIVAQGKKYTLNEEIRWIKKTLSNIKSGKEVCILAIYKDRVISNTAINRVNDGTEAHLGSLGIAISEGFRDKGLGTILLNEIHKEAKAKIKGLKIFTLNVFGDNKRGLYMYKKFGYKICGSFPKGVNHAGKFVDHITMYKKV